MPTLRSLFNDSIIYGISTIVGRTINFFLVPFYTSEVLLNNGTKVSVLSKQDFGVMTDVYAIVAFLNVLFAFGLETSFFRFSENKEKSNVIFSVSLLSTFLFGVLSCLFFQYVYGISLGLTAFVSIIFILIVDSVCVIPFASLRLHGFKMKFSLIKLTGILVTVAFNIYFLRLCKFNLIPDFLQIHLFKGLDGYEVVFLSNLIGNFIMLLLLLPSFFNLKVRWSLSEALSILKYSLPLMVLGLAGMVNEVLDRVMLRKLIPLESIDERLEVVAEYGAVYKLGIFIALANQAFRFGAEPFFFKKSTESDAKKTYAVTLKFYFIFTLAVMLSISLFRNDIGFLVLRSDTFREGIYVVPLLLLANVFLGVYYNQSIWYKLTDKTYYGTIISIIGALITFVVNYLFIPIYGYLACAWATLICYTSMMLLSFFWGRKHYHVAYDYLGLLKYLTIVVVCVSITYLPIYKNSSYLIQLGFNIIALILLFLYTAVKENLFRKFKST